MNSIGKFGLLGVLLVITGNGTLPQADPGILPASATIAIVASLETLLNLEAVDKLGFTDPTPIQQKSIPLGLEGNDLIAIAQTGTGKTLAFGIPMLQRLAGLRGKGLVLVPTRELALQVEEAITDVGKAPGVRTAVLIGGASIVVQQRALAKKPRIIVATPGRLIDHVERKHVDLRDVEILVLDEADRMLDMGFIPDVRTIVYSTPPKNKRQTMFFSATLTPEVERLAVQWTQNPVHIEIEPDRVAAESVNQLVYIVTAEEKDGIFIQIQFCHLIHYASNRTIHSGDHGGIGRSRIVMRQIPIAVIWRIIPFTHVFLQ